MSKVNGPKSFFLDEVAQFNPRHLLSLPIPASSLCNLLHNAVLPLLPMLNGQILSFVRKKEEEEKEEMRLTLFIGAKPIEEVSKQQNKRAAK